MRARIVPNVGGLSRVFSLIVLAALLASCGGPDRSEAQGISLEGPKKPNPKLKTVELALGPARVAAELARSPAERETGLMYRKSLEDGKGMLFIFPSDERLAFWMKNTTIPLSLAYISSDGTIQEILALEPGSLSPVASERSVRYALEVPRGWFERAGVKVGDKMELPPLD